MLKKDSGSYDKYIVIKSKQNLFLIFTNIILLGLNLGIPLRIVGNFEILFVKTFALFGIFSIIIIFIIVWFYALRSLEFFKPIGQKRKRLIFFIKDSESFKLIILSSIILCYFPFWLL